MRASLRSPSEGVSGPRCAFPEPLFLASADPCTCINAHTPTAKFPPSLPSHPLPPPSTPRSPVSYSAISLSSVDTFLHCVYHGQSVKEQRPTTWPQESTKVCLSSGVPVRRRPLTTWQTILPRPISTIVYSGIPFPTFPTFVLRRNPTSYPERHYLPYKSYCVVP